MEKFDRKSLTLESFTKLLKEILTAQEYLVLVAYIERKHKNDPIDSKIAEARITKLERPIVVKSASLKLIKFMVENTELTRFQLPKRMVCYFDGVSGLMVHCRGVIKWDGDITEENLFKFLESNLSERSFLLMKEKLEDKSYEDIEKSNPLDVGVHAYGCRLKDILAQVSVALRESFGAGVSLNYRFFMSQRSARSLDLVLDYLKDKAQVPR